MQSTTPTALSRYRPAILVVAGVAAAFAGYQIYAVAQTSSTPASGLHRSNAVRRPNARQREAARVFAILNGEEPLNLGEFSYGTDSIPLSLDFVASHDRVRNAVASLRAPDDPPVPPGDLERLYFTFIERLYFAIDPDRQSSSTQEELVMRWIAERYPDNQALLDSSVRYHGPLTRTAEVTDAPESVAGTEISRGSDHGTDADEGDVDGQTLQRTLYHIAEDRARQEGVVHRGITCNGCDEKPIRGIRWHCANCADFDLCSNCEATNSHTKTHVFYKIRVPAPYLSINKQETLYPGKPHLMPPSVNSVLKRRLVADTKMEAEEIEALWDQFTCLAGTEWMSDPNHIHWALDRRSFNHAFIPRYNSFVAAPNLIYDRIFAYYDTDKNGLIGFEEWIKGLDGMHASSGHRRVKIVFDGYDVDEDGYISRKDVLRILRAYYAIEKEATRNFVAEITEELSVRRAMDTINSSRPLGSAFPPHDLSRLYADHSRLWSKNENQLDSASPVIVDDTNDVASREDMLRATELRNLPPGILPQEVQDRLLVDRWARRHFYLDEEEGFSRPEAAQNEEPAAEPSGEASRPARSSSTSDTSVSSLVIPDDLYGYKIPEPEKDLGQEIMYQITQQGFNELLDPLFLDKETNAIDARATRKERRKHAKEITNMIEKFKSKIAPENRAVAKVGFFRYAKAVTELFFSELERECDGGGMKDFFLDDHATQLSYEDGNTKLVPRLKAVENAIIQTIDVPENYSVDEMLLWNISLCRYKLREEIVSGVLQSAYVERWIAPFGEPSVELEETPNEKAQTRDSGPALDRDPTMPQFRPNSLADIASPAPALRYRSASTSTESTIESDLSYGPRTLTTFYPQPDDEGMVIFRPSGPFFAMEQPNYIGYISPVDEDVVMTDADAESDQAVAVAPPAPSPPEPAPTQEEPTLFIPETDPSRPWSTLKPTTRISTYSNSPVIHLIHTISTSPIDSAPRIAVAPKSITYAPNPFYPENDPQVLLFRYIRALASKPESRSYLTWLASLDTAQREVDERNGSGLISLDEFESFVELGTCRFLEAWMEWVSI